MGLKNFVKTKVGMTLFDIVRSRGWEIIGDRFTPEYLNGYGVDPDLVIDVGVFDGTPWLYRHFQGKKFLLVDPLEESRKMVEKNSPGIDYDFEVVALGPENGEAELNVPSFEKGTAFNAASLLERQDVLADRFSKVESRSVPVVPLDDLTKKYPGRIALKIDTEGFEYQVLKGARETLNRADFVVLEFSVSKRFDGLAKPSEVTALLAEHGLEFRDIMASSPFVKNGPPRHMDVVFMRWS